MRAAESGPAQVAVDPAELIEQNDSQEVRRSPPDLPGRTAAGTPGPTLSKDHPCHACARPSRACATLPLRPGGTFSSNILAMTRRGWSDSRGGQASLCRRGDLCHRHDLIVRHSWAAGSQAGESYSAGADHGGPLPSSDELVVARRLPPGQQGGTATLTCMQAGATSP